MTNSPLCGFSVGVSYSNTRNNTKCYQPPAKLRLGVILRAKIPQRVGLLLTPMVPQTGLYPDESCVLSSGLALSCSSLEWYFLLHHDIKERKLMVTQLEVQWAYSGHLVHLQWGNVHALHVIYIGHCKNAQPAL